MPTKRIPFAQDITTRDGTLAKDSKTVNAVFEKNGSDLDLVKRPGMAAFASISTIAARRPGVSAWRQWIFFASAHHLYSYDTVLMTLTDYGAILNTGPPMSFARTYLDKNLFFHDGLQFYNTTDGVTITTPTPPTASFGWVPGAVWLNDFVYVGNQSENLIYSCHTGDPTSWTSTSSIAFFQTTDSLVALAKHLNMVVAFGYRSMQFYYDAGTGDGSTVSSLATASSYACEIGCANPLSIASAENTVVWVGFSQTEGKAVYMLNGISPIKVSTPSIDKILESNPGFVGFIYRFFGHSVYVLTSSVNSGGPTLAYDMTTQMWSQWTQSISGVEGTLEVVGYAQTSPFTDAAFLIGLGANDPVYKLDINTYQDNGQTINVRSVTELDDEGSTKMKFYRRAEIVGDTSNTSVQLSYTKDDYQTYSNPRTIGLSTFRPARYQFSQSRRRAWQMLHTDNTPLRLKALEIDFELGELDTQQ